MGRSRSQTSAGLSRSTPAKAIEGIDSDCLLGTKFSPSFISGPLLRRDRLFHKLQSNPAAPLVFVHGAAGSGKSSLLYQYIKTQDAPSAWYALEESDRDPKIFSQYLFTSLSLHHPFVSEEILPRIRKVISIEQEWKNILTIFINSVQKYGKKVWIVLDDFHALDDSKSILLITDFLLLHAPTNFKCFIASRVMPKLSIAYLKSKNALVLVKPEDLRLNLKETQQLFNQIWHLPLPEDSFKMIHEKTEGWLAAARLIAQTIQEKSSSERKAYLERLQPGEDFIYHYLAHEVYFRQPPELKIFLKNTSVLNSFNAELASWMSGLSESREIIRKLEAMNLFVIHLDEKQEWYRYHNLFSQFLQSLLQKEDGDEAMRLLHKRAGIWHEKQKNIGEGLGHFLSAREFDTVVRILNEEGEKLFRQGLFVSLNEWISAIPQGLRETSSAVLTLEGQVQDALGNWEKAIRTYGKAIQLLKSHGMREEALSILEKLILCFIRYGEYSRIAASCQEALEICKPQDKILLSRILSRCAAAEVLRGDKDWKRGYQHLRKGYLMAYDSGDVEAIATACNCYGFSYHFPQGNFTESRHVFSEGAQLLNRMGFPFLAANQIMNKAVVEIFEGELEVAEKTLLEAEKIAEKHQAYFITQALFVARLILCIHKKDKVEAEKFASFASQESIPLQLRPWFFCFIALLRDMEGKQEQAQVAGLEMLNQLQLVGKGMYAPECYLTMGFLFWKKNLPHEARKWFEKALSTAELGEMKFWMAKAHYCLARFFEKIENAPIEFADHYRMAIRFTSENNYYHLWSINLYGFTAPVLLAAVHANLEPVETQRIIRLVGSQLLKEFEAILEHGGKQERSVVCKLLEIMGNERAFAILEKINKRIPGLPRLASPALCFKTLGSFEVKRGDKTVMPEEWHRPKALRILKYFVARFPEEIIVDELVETFWPNHSFKDARHNLAVCINYVRKALNPLAPRRDETFIQAEQDVYKFNLREEDRLDVLEFQNLCEKGDKFWKENQFEEAVRNFKAALKLYHGDFMEEERYSEWTIQRREDLSKKYLSILERMGSFHEKNLEFKEAVIYYRQYLENHPLQEKIVESMLSCLVALGDRFSAKKEYDRFKLIMKEQFSESPSPMLEAIFNSAIRRTD